MNELFYLGWWIRAHHLLYLTCINGIVPKYSNIYCGHIPENISVVRNMSGCFDFKN
jgi:hypothetical protein